MTDGANVELSREIFSAANRAAETGEFDDWLNFFSEDIVWEAAEDAPDAGTYRRHRGIRGYFEDWLDTVDGARSEMRGLTEVGDRVVTDIRAHGRIKGNRYRDRARLLPGVADRGRKDHPRQGIPQAR